MIAALMLAFEFLGLLAGQLANNSHRARGLSLGMIGVSFLVRAVIDGSRSVAPWATPLSWFEEIRPFGDTRWWPYLALLALAAAGLTGSLALAGRRDLGASLITPCPGPATTSRAAGPLWLAFRPTRSTWLGWLIDTVVWGLAMGWASDQTRRFLQEYPDVGRLPEVSALLGKGLMGSRRASRRALGRLLLGPSEASSRPTEETGKIGPSQDYQRPD